MQATTPWKTTDAYPVVTIALKNGAVMTAELYPDKAPNTVHSFIFLVKQGFFDGKVFHRSVPGFMIQGGSSDGTSASSDDSYQIKGEFSENGFSQNDLKHARGVLSMARTSDPNSATTQFFIMHGAAPFLDGKYAAFGKLTTGIEVVDEIVKGATRSEMLLEPVEIQSMKVETFNVIYPEPVKR